MLKKTGALIAGVLACCGLASMAWALEEEPADNYNIVTHLSLDDAKKKIFPQADAFLEKQVHLNADQAARVQARVGHPLLNNECTVWVAKQGDSILGYAIVDEEIGKYRPITSMVGVSPEGKVLGVAIMVYRESRGGEVARRRFLAQYEGKTTRDPIRVRKDIVSMAGATLSVHAISTQVRKVLAIVQEAFLKGSSPRQ